MSHSQAAARSEGRPLGTGAEGSPGRSGRIVLIRDGRCIRPVRQRRRGLHGLFSNLTKK